MSLSACLNGYLQTVHESLCMFACSSACLLSCIPVYIYLSICLSVHNSICQYECMKCMSDSLSALVSSYVYINIGLSVCRSLCICFSVPLSPLSVSACQFVCQHFYVSLYMFLFLSECLYIQQSVHCLHFGLSISSFNSLSFFLSAYVRPSVVSIGCLKS